MLLLLLWLLLMAVAADAPRADPPCEKADLLLPFCEGKPVGDSLELGDGDE